MCAYKPPVVNNASMSGLANVRKSTDGSKFKITIKVKEDDKVETKTYTLPAKECPAYLKTGDWRVRMKKDGSKMYSAVPSDAIVKVRFSDIAHRENEEPTPSTHRGPYGDITQFTMILKIVDGEYKGIEIPLYLNYNFTPVEVDGKNVVGYSHPKSKYTTLLMETLDALGVWGDDFGPMGWSDNILPKLKKRAMKAGSNGIAAQVTLGDGFVAKIKALGEVEEDEEEVTEPKNLVVEDDDEDDDVETPDEEELDENWD